MRNYRDKWKISQEVELSRKKNGGFQEINWAIIWNLVFVEKKFGTMENMKIILNSTAARKFEYSTM